MTRPTNLIANDIARCEGNGSPDCTGCLRRHQFHADREHTDAPWAPVMQPAATDSGCSYLMRGRV